MRRVPSGHKWQLLLLLGAVLAASPLIHAGKKEVIGSPHDLSATSPNARTAEKQVCTFCHTPHRSLADVKPLWNRQLPVQSYSLYTSTTLSATMQQPGQISKRCLSCHDGTVALGQTVANGLIPVQRSLREKANLGGDLGNDHPVNFEIVNDGQLVTSLFQAPPSTADKSVKLFAGRIECTTCHDPHVPDVDAESRSFLVRSNSGGAICLACHDPSQQQPNPLNGWNSGKHALSSHSTPATGQFGIYGNVAANACLNCHLSHGAPKASSSRLLRAAEESACGNCHAGTNVVPSIVNVMAEFNKTYAHPTTTSNGRHEAAEKAEGLNRNRHAECPDCHNAHASGGPTPPIPPGVQPALAGVSGVDKADGKTPLQPARNEYEVCFKCHADSSNKPQADSRYTAYGRTPWRVTDSAVQDPFNTRLEFESGISRHPVTQAQSKTNLQVPSLRPGILNLDGGTERPLGQGAYLYCTDCHANDASRNSGGTGANGPHGSSWSHLLQRRYELETAPPNPGDPAPGILYAGGGNGSYALCSRCHDIENSVLRDRSFRLHALHVQQVRASCSTCHDAHGVQGGTATNNHSLVNFDTAIVAPNSVGDLRFERVGEFSGRCYLRCHGSDHVPKAY